MDTTVETVQVDEDVTVLLYQGVGIPGFWVIDRIEPSVERPERSAVDGHRAALASGLDGVPRDGVVPAPPFTVLDYLW